jgi:hypothetical protein
MQSKSTTNPRPKPRRKSHRARGIRKEELAPIKAWAAQRFQKLAKEAIDRYFVSCNATVADDPANKRRCEEAATRLQQATREAGLEKAVR